MTDADKVMNQKKFGSDLAGNLDSNPGSLLVEVRRLGGGLRSLSTAWLRMSCTGWQLWKSRLELPHVPFYFACKCIFL